MYDSAMTFFNQNVRKGKERTDQSRLAWYFP